MSAFTRIGALFCIALCSWQVELVAQQRSPFELLDQISKAKGIPIGSLELGQPSTVKYPVTNVTLEVAKVRDTRTGEVYLAAVDQNGRALDPQAASAAEESAREKKYGKLDPKLHDLVTRSFLKNWIDVQSRVSVSPWPGVFGGQDEAAALRPRRSSVKAEWFQLPFMHSATSASECGVGYKRHR